MPESSLLPTPCLDRKIMQIDSVASPRNCSGAQLCCSSTGQLHPCEEGWRFTEELDTQPGKMYKVAKVVSAVREEKLVF